MSQKLNLIQEPWYAEGLSFKCTECGQCCTGAPGHVWVTQDEVRTMAQHLGLSVDEFSQRYLRRAKGRLSLIEDPRNYDCCFLKDGKCSIYQVRPEQCRTFPWWPQNLKSPEAWRQAASDCEGICTEAARVDAQTIQEQLNRQEVAESKY